ncbi:MAG TPA: excisionase family DNA-binding protein [Microthrixaceae bacterium]|nr:excisionase family DNA-binding protein [Microthrixaceae bacterium]
MTAVQSAELLNVSRPHLIKQIEAGEVPHHMVGKHRRLKLVDVLAYRLEKQAGEALDAMALRRRRDPQLHVRLDQLNTRGETAADARRDSMRRSRLPPQPRSWAPKLISAAVLKRDERRASERQLAEAGRKQS